MIIVTWRGKAVSKNRRYRITREKPPALVKTDEYKAWLMSIGWTIKSVTLKRYRKIDWIMINSRLDRQADHHNLVDVVCDALQKCGLIEDDRNIGVVMSMPCERHKRGEPDEIQLSIGPGEIIE